jgi:dTDP-4-dehydrorhamnose 3,5-epimerase
MKFHPTNLSGAFVIEYKPNTDNRGKFTRLYCMYEFERLRCHSPIDQINHSFTKHKGTIRGMHYQIGSEAKIVTVLKGWIFDVVIDVRHGSPTFLQHHVEFLEASKPRSLYVPAGFAHGFQALEDDCELLYFHTDFYSKEDSRVIKYDDPRVGIAWPREVTEISEQDRDCPYLTDEFEGMT